MIKAAEVSVEHEEGDSLVSKRSELREQLVIVDDLLKDLQKAEKNNVVAIDQSKNTSVLFSIKFYCTVL